MSTMNLICELVSAPQPEINGEEQRAELVNFLERIIVWEEQLALYVGLMSGAISSEEFYEIPSEDEFNSLLVRRWQAVSDQTIVGLLRCPLTIAKLAKFVWREHLETWSDVINSGIDFLNISAYDDSTEIAPGAPKVDLDSSATWAMDENFERSRLPQLALSSSPSAESATHHRQRWTILLAVESGTFEGPQEGLIEWENRLAGGKLEMSLALDVAEPPSSLTVEIQIDLIDEIAITFASLLLNQKQRTGEAIGNMVMFAIDDPADLEQTSFSFHVTLDNECRIEFSSIPLKTN